MRDSQPSAAIAPKIARSLLTAALLGSVLTALLPACSRPQRDEPVVEPDASAAASTPSLLMGQSAAPKGFDASAICSGELSADAIPEKPAFGRLSTKDSREPTLDFVLVSGRVDVRDDRVALRLSKDDLKPCSPLRKDEEVSRELRIGVTVTGALEARTWRFPESSGTFKYWNYVYPGARDLVTVNALAPKDSGLLVFDSVDQEAGRASGRLLLCRGGGLSGFIAGTFEVPICRR